MQAEKNLKVALLLTGAALIAELIGWVISNSMALLSDAMHVLLHLSSLGLVFFALKISLRPPTLTKTFGYHRAEIFAALINGITLSAISLVIFYEALQRFFTPQSVKGLEMFGFAIAGLFPNLWVVLKFRGSKDISIKSAFFHALGDSLASLGVILGAALIMFFEFYFIDPLLSIVIAIWILLTAVKIVLDSSHILLEGAPRDVTIDEVIEEIKKVKHVLDVHDVHLWSLCSNLHALNAHLLVNDLRVSQTQRIVTSVNNRLRKFGIFKTSFQFEAKRCKKGKLHHLRH
jgi:cobalt-zinc-cadmium efflux system protein